jgi:cytochrome c oxidase assembly factor CtaG/putative copper export protein
VALVAGGGAHPVSVPGIPNTPSVVEWGLPVARMLTDLAMLVAIGTALLALLLPLRRGAASADARGSLRAAAVAAVVGAVAMTVTSVFILSETSFLPLSEAFSPRYIRDLLATQACSYLLISAGLLLATALAAGWAARRGGPDSGFPPLVLGLGALIPIAFTGHANTGRGHLIAITALAVHLIGVCLWVGGLSVVGVYALRRGRALAVVVPRYSRVAATCYAMVGFSGIANAATRLIHLDQLFTTSYGVLVLAKTAAYLLLGLLALGQRRRVLPALARAAAGSAAAGSSRNGARRAFARLAAIEIILMTATVGLAVALSRTPTPAVPPATTNIEALLDEGMPARPTLYRLVFDAWYDPVFSTLAIVAVTFYLWGAIRLHRRGDKWPVNRTILWITGWAIAVVTTCSGLGRYSAISFSAHMAQHMLLTMLAPIPMVLGAPITLALRSLHQAPAGCRGPRDWLVAALNSPVAKVVGHPIFGFVLFLASFYGLYFSPLFPWLMSGHIGHVAMNLHFLFSGYLLFWSICGLDHAPVRLPHLGRLVLMLAAAPFHAFFAIALVNTSTVLAKSWYSQLQVPWDRNLLSDQHLGGNLTWGFGEVPILLVSIALIFQWIRSDEKDARRHDRRADANGDAELAAYNDYLASLARRNSGAGNSR